jgi:hypothetical protein
MFHAHGRNFFPRSSCFVRDWGTVLSIANKTNQRCFRGQSCECLAFWRRGLGGSC